MKLTYYKTIFSFCPDLTDPYAESIPVAVLLLGEFRNGRLAFVAELPWDYEKISLDPLTKKLLSNIGTFIRHQVDKSFALRSSAPLVERIKSIHHGLRNSLHVSKSEGPFENELPLMQDRVASLSAELQKEIVSTALKLLQDVLGLDEGQEELDNLAYHTPSSLPSFSPSNGYSFSPVSHIPRTQSWELPARSSV